MVFCAILLNEMEIIKTCKKHGPLTADQVSIRERKDRAPGSVYIRCKLCHRSSASSARKEARRLYREGLSDQKYSSDIKVAEDRKLNPEKYRQWAANHRKKQGSLRNVVEICRRAGITVDQYQEMLRNQNNVCKICLNPETRTFKGKPMNLCLSLCPKTRKAKAFLCSECNMGLGLFEYNPDIIRSAIAYLKRFKNGN